MMLILKIKQITLKNHYQFVFCLNIIYLSIKSTVLPWWQCHAWCSSTFDFSRTIVSDANC